MIAVSAAEEIRLGVLDRVLDGVQHASTLAPELFSSVDVLEEQPTLRRALTDPGSDVEARKGLVAKLFGGKVSDDCVKVLTEAVSQRWTRGGALTSALERQAIRAELRAAMDNGQLDDVEDELFRFDRLVASDRSLRDALADRTYEVGYRQDLVTKLLDGKAHEATVVLARRAVRARERNFADTVEGYLNLAAEMRNRGVATVRVARPLTDEQTSRLQAALSRQVGREVALHVIVDPDVVGGVRVELGDEVIEGTVQGRLDQAHRKFQA